MTDLLGRALRNAILAFLCIVSAYVILKPYTERETDPAAVRQNSGNTVFYDYRDSCWKGSKPPWAPEYPGHVVMRIEGGVRDGQWFYGGKHYVDIALNDVFTRDDPRVFVYAFCR